MRVLGKSWSDRKPFTRRVRWYCEDLTPEGRSRNVRLVFEDSEGVANRHYGSNALAAEGEWRAFREGRLTTRKLRATPPAPLWAKSIDKVVQQEMDRADSFASTVTCDSCGKPLRADGAMRKGGKLWHQGCPPPKGVRK